MGAHCAGNLSPPVGSGNAPPSRTHWDTFRCAGDSRPDWIEASRSHARITTKKNSYTLPSGKQIGVNEATVIFYARDLTDKALRMIYNGVRGYVGGKGTKGMEDKDEAILELVQSLGGPPQEHGSKGPFWRKALEYWNREHPDDPYGTPDSLRMRYRRGLKPLRLPQGSYPTARRLRRMVVQSGTERNPFSVLVGTITHVRPLLNLP